MVAITAPLLPPGSKVNPDILGCEYECPNPNRPTESCNGIDHDCDGIIDELPIVGLGSTIGIGREARNVVVAVDGTLVTEKESAKRIQISGVETGYVNVSIAADGVERSSRVWISSGKTTALPVGNPGSPQGMHPLLNTGLSIVAFLISRAATDYLF